MKDKNPLISIIVPVYNVAGYLEQCVKSLVNQTYNNVEIILVDDGSTDGSEKLCDEYALGSAQILVVHSENKGPAQARNIGISLAKGDYLMFVDSDDWVDSHICEVLLNAIFEYGVQSSMCSYVREYPDKSLPKVICNENTVFSGTAIQRKLCGPIKAELRHPENLDCLNTLCGRLYPTVVLKEKVLTDINIIGPSEDLLYNFQVFSGIDSMVYIIQPLYHYRKTVVGSVTATYKPNMDQKWNLLYDKMMEIIEKEQLDHLCYEAINNRIAINVLGIGLNCISGDAGLIEKYKRLKLAMSNDRRRRALRLLPLKEMPSYWKIFYFCAKHNMCLLICIMLLCINVMRGKV